MTNDAHFDPRAHVRSLSGDAALAYASAVFDELCDAQDARFLREVMGAGEQSPAVTYQHAQGGSPMAQLVHGAAALRGSEPGQASEGLFWLLRAHNNGNAQASLVLAGSYLDGRHLSVDRRKALAFATAASDRGLPAGHFVLANLLLEDATRADEQDLAIHLLQQAARGGHAPAVAQLQESGIPLDVGGR